MNDLAVQAYSLLMGIALAAAGIQVGPGTLTAHAVVNSGHRGAVLDVVEDHARGLLFSVGADGFLRVWDTGAGTLVRRLAVSRQQARSVALDSTAPLAAVVVTDGVRSFAVDVWDWDAGKRLYSIPLGGAPLFVGFSRSGTYLMCGDMQWNGFHVFRARDGTTVPFHPEGFGMVSFAEASRSDATLMTYQPAGMLTYWSLGSGQPIKEVPTVAGLVNVRASDDRSSLVGQSGTEIIGIDAITGDTRFQLDAPGMTSMDISADASRIACLLSDGTLQLQAPAAGTPIPSAISGRFDWKPRVVRMTAEGILLAGDDGQIGMITAHGTATEFVRDVLARVSSVAASGHLLAVSAGGVIHVFLIAANGPGVGPVTESFSFSNPCDGPVGLQFLDRQRLVIWQQGEGAGSVGAVDLSSRQYTRWGFTFDGPLAAVTSRDGLLFTLEKSGNVKVLDPESGAQVFQSSWPGAACLAPLGSDSIALGRLSGGALGSSLVRIDLRTGETAPLPGSATLTFALAPDPAGGGLYSLGVSADGHTRLTRYDGAELQTETIVDSADGEFPSASLSFDPISDALYTSLGREVVKSWNGASLQRLADPARGTLSLYALEGLLASLQRDSSVTLWDTAADRSFGEIYPFADGSWAAVMADGTILGSPDGREKVGILVRGRLWEAGNTPSAPPSQEKPPAP
jgi:WD40 repeat protein